MEPKAARAGRDEDGQANLFFLIGLTLSLIAIMLLFVRLGNANNLRSDAQTAADAAAIAAAGIARDNAAHSLADGQIPYSRLYEPAEGKSAAQYYAEKNGAVLEDIRASDDSQGNLGNVVRVEIRSADCQRELTQDRSTPWTAIACGENDADSASAHVGNAAAIAKVVLPDCEYVIGDIDILGVTCDGQRVQSFAHAQQLIDVQLTDSEGQYIYKPLGNDLASAPLQGETST